MKKQSISFFTYNLIFGLGFIVAVILSGCNKYLDTPLPVDQITVANAFISDGTTSSVVTGILMDNYNKGFFQNSNSIGYTSGLYTDELQNLNNQSTGNVAYYTDNVESTITGGLWQGLYAEIYKDNASIEGIQKSTSRLTFRNQWLGESYFLRALHYFYLTNLYGDVPLVISTDVQANNHLAKSPRADVFNQIIADLKLAQSILPSDYSDGLGSPTTDRGRPNRSAATALLARMYLYTSKWQDAEIQADSLISNSNFKLELPANTFLATSQETIWGISPVAPSGFVGDYNAYNGGMPAVIPANNTVLTYGVNVALSNSLISLFDTTDTRYTNWVRSSVAPASGTIPAIKYYFPNKYKSISPGAENIVMFRLAEQYLIRAEARAEQNNLSGAQSDLNQVRSRAGVPPVNLVLQADLLSAIAVERQRELFTENGQRFFDLKRTGTIDQVMNAVAPVKGGTWASFKSVWALPQNDLIEDPNLKQNPGYE